MLHRPGEHPRGALCPARALFDLAPAAAAAQPAACAARAARPGVHAQAAALPAAAPAPAPAAPVATPGEGIESARAEPAPDGAGTAGSGREAARGGRAPVDRRLWLWLHPAAFEDALAALQHACAECGVSVVPRCGNTVGRRKLLTRRACSPCAAAYDQGLTAVPERWSWASVCLPCRAAQMSSLTWPQSLLINGANQQTCTFTSLCCSEVQLCRTLAAFVALWQAFQVVGPAETRHVRAHLGTTACGCRDGLRRLELAGSGSDRIIAAALGHQAPQEAPRASGPEDAGGVARALWALMRSTGARVRLRQHCMLRGP